MTKRETGNPKIILPRRAFTYLFATILFSSILAMSSVFATILSVSSTFALIEESEVDVKFTFNPMLTLSVSSADIIIPNLIPGTSDNSNTVAVTVNTNNQWLYGSSSL